MDFSLTLEDSGSESESEIVLSQKRLLNQLPFYPNVILLTGPQFFAEFQICQLILLCKLSTIFLHIENTIHSRKLIK